MNRHTKENTRLKLKEKDVMMGLNESGRIWRHAIIVGKYVITSRKSLNIANFISRIQSDFQVEKLAASVKNVLPTFVNKWGALIDFFGNEGPRQ